MPLTVLPVETHRDFMTFVKLPWRLYAGNRNWVPPLLNDQKTLLSPEKNPFFQHASAQLFLAENDGRIVGRIAAIHDPSYVAFQEESVGFFGFYESVNDQAVADALFAAARRWLAEQGVAVMRGPTNPSTNDTLGLLIDAFDKPPVVMMPYNHDYYPALFEAAGLSKAKDLYAYWLSEDRMRIDRLDRFVERLQKRHNLRLRPVNLKRLDLELPVFKEIYNDAWDKNWGFVPWTDAEIEHLGEELGPVADPELIMFAYKDDIPVGFSLSLPNLNQALIHVKRGRLFPFGLLKLLYWSRRVDHVRVLAMGIKRDYRNLGIDALFYHRTFRYAETVGQQRGECSWILEDNQAMNTAMEKMGGRVYKTYRMYDQPLVGA